MLGAIRHSDEIPDILIRQALANGGVSSPLSHFSFSLILFRSMYLCRRIQDVQPYLDDYYYYYYYFYFFCKRLCLSGSLYVPHHLLFFRFEERTVLYHFMLALSSPPFIITIIILSFIFSIRAFPHLEPIFPSLPSISFSYFILIPLSYILDDSMTSLTLFPLCLYIDRDFFSLLCVANWKWKHFRESGCFRCCSMSR